MKTPDVSIERSPRDRVPTKYTHVNMHALLPTPSLTHRHQANIYFKLKLFWCGDTQSPAHGRRTQAPLIGFGSKPGLVYIRVPG